MSKSDVPRLVTDRRFRSRVRGLLVELPNNTQGLGLKVTGDENVVMTFTRFGRRMKTRSDLLALRWYSVRVDDGSSEPSFETMTPEAVMAFLEGLAAAI